MRHRLLPAAPLLLLCLLLVPRLASAQVRIKDITDVEGVRSNQLVGYGLVVGLNGTGDQLNNSAFTRQSLVGMLDRLGVNTADLSAQLQTKDIAAVMVTANLPPFAREGSRFDVGVSALGDATNLSGGTLLVTPLLGADGEVYGVAQGPVATGAIAVQGAAQSVTQGVPTSGRIANGAIVEREIPFQLGEEHTLDLALRNADLTTAERIAAAINRTLADRIAEVTDPRTVVLHLEGRDVVDTLARIEDLTVVPDSPAIVVIDESTGTIVMGANVRISEVAIAQGNLTVRVTETPQVSQPGPFSNGTTVVTPQTNIQIDTQPGHRLALLPTTVTLQQLVSGLNSLGVGPRDMITILQNIKADGALQAELRVR
ncbi:MAG TPA: flagellar basal body P-ring protein FlgI [Acetobacteraceae bacterium]|nr:flagellar basal body P-ring protein FlgI [Acetobacteraceae bacterium]